MSERVDKFRRDRVQIGVTILIKIARVEDSTRCDAMRRDALALTRRVRCSIQLIGKLIIESTYDTKSKLIPNTFPEKLHFLVNLGIALRE